MFLPVRSDVFRWSTPDPTDDWIMVGHLFVSDSGVILVDPPVVPGLLESVSRLGKLKAVILTTMNHTRGSRFISERSGVPVYLPDQDKEKVGEKEWISMKEIENIKIYGEEKVLGFEALKFDDDYALVSGEGDLLVGDNTVADIHGKLLPAPDWFPGVTSEQLSSPRYQEFRNRIVERLKEIARQTGATNFLGSHGYDIIGNLQPLVEGL